MKLKIYNTSGEHVGEVEVSKDIFDVEFNKGLVHQALVMQHANGRQVVAKTKTRGEINGGGRKPWKQKGTGRARAGTTRSPVWRGGGIVFGPTGEENFSKAMPKKQRRLALCSALSEKNREKQVLALEEWNMKEMKTKVFAQVLGKLPVDRSTLFVIPQPNEIFEKSASNLPNVKVILSQYLNIADLLKYKFIVILKDSLPIIEKTFSRS